MNYIRELNAFRDWVLLNRLSTGQIALWHSLMCINNRTGWSEWFTTPNQTLQLMTGLSRQGLDKARLQLSQQNLIQYRKGKSNNAGQYKIISFSESECQIVGTEIDTEGAFQESQEGHKSSTLFKQKQKQKELNDPPISPKGERFTPPALDAVIAYCEERQNNVDAGKWFDFYSSKGWMVGRNKMKDWKAAVRTWEKNDFKPQSQYQRTKDKLTQLYQEAVADEQAGNY